MTYNDRLAARIKSVGSVLCVGIDPDTTAIPTSFFEGRTMAEGVLAYCSALINATAPYAAAYKINFAFFEALGDPGLSVLRQVRMAVPAEIPTIADAKRGDIGNTAKRYAAAIFEQMSFDAVTLNAFMGRETIDPFWSYRDRGVYVLVRTSNPSATEVQDFGPPGHPLSHQMAQWLAQWVSQGGTAGATGMVVGATTGSELAYLAAAHPTLGLLIPGLGAQGGSVGDVRALMAMQRAPLLANVSRGISQLDAPDEDPLLGWKARAEYWSSQLSTRVDKATT